jgi:hypothetical protein
LAIEAGTPAFDRESLRMGSDERSDSFEILPGIGLGRLKFGMSTTEAEELLGVPEEIADFDSDRHLHYPNIGVFLFFSEDEGCALSGIEVNSRCNCTLAGEKVFPRKREGVASLLLRYNTQACLANDVAVIHLEKDGGTRLTSRKLGVDFYFDATNHLESINWSDNDLNGD